MTSPPATLVRQRRLDRGLTLEQVALAVDLTMPQMSRLETGRDREVTVATAERIADLLGLSTAELAESGLELTRPDDPEWRFGYTLSTDPTLDDAGRAELLETYRRLTSR